MILLAFTAGFIAAILGMVSGVVLTHAAKNLSKTESDD